MELRQLEMFVAVTEQGSVTRAAAALLVAQPSVSSQLHLLEAELGHPLFDRLPRGVRLTEVGRLVLPHARRVLREVAEITNDIDDLSGLRRGHLAVGTMSTMTSHFFPSVVKQFRDQFPGIELSVMESRTSGLVDAVLTHRVDLALVTTFPPNPQIEEVHLFNEEIVAILAPDDPLAERGEIDLAELAKRPFLMLEPGFGTYAVAVEACREAGFAPRITLELESMQAIKALVEIGMGVSLVPRVVALLEEQLGRLGIVSLRAPRPMRPIELITARGSYLSRAAQAFIAICRDQAGGAGRVTPRAALARTADGRAD